MSHYWYKRYGPDDPVERKAWILARIHTKKHIDEVTGCWNWTGGKQYRRTSTSGEVVYRGVYQEYTGTKNGKRHVISRLAAWIFLDFNLSSKKIICHTCDNPMCWNPEHLWVGTPKENTQDRIRKKRFLRFSRKGATIKE